MNEENNSTDESNQNTQTFSLYTTTHISTESIQNLRNRCNKLSEDNLKIILQQADETRQHVEYKKKTDLIIAEQQTYTKQIESQQLKKVRISTKALNDEIIKNQELTSQMEGHNDTLSKYASQIESLERNLAEAKNMINLLYTKAKKEEKKFDDMYNTLQTRLVQLERDRDNAIENENILRYPSREPSARPASWLKRARTDSPEVVPEDRCNLFYCADRCL